MRTAPKVGGTGRSAERDVVRCGTPGRAMVPTPARSYRRAMLLVQLDPEERGADEESGAVATEYGLILTLVVLVTVLAITVFGLAVADLFDRGTAPF